MKRVKKNDERKNLVIPKMKAYVSREVSMKDASSEFINSLTANGVCLRPDIYLDYGCYDCPYAKACNASRAKVA